MPTSCAKGKAHYFNIILDIFCVVQIPEDKSLVQITFIIQSLNSACVNRADEHW